MSAPDLLPCPFCGDDKVASFARTCDRHTPYNPADRTYPVVRCSCGVEVPGANWSEPETAIATWNKRAPTAPQGAEPAYRPALAALMDYKQADEDGVMVLVSRQAIHEVFDALTWHDKHAAPQGAEIAREAPRSAHPDVVRLLREFHLDAMGRGHDPNHALTKLMVSGYMQKRGPEVIAALAAHDRMMAEVSAAIDAALTPTDAETKGAEARK